MVLSKKEKESLGSMAKYFLCEARVIAIDHSTNAK
jgi:hypothetical protein